MMMLSPPRVQDFPIFLVGYSKLRKIIVMLALAAFVCDSPASAQTGSKTAKNGGIGSAASTYPGGELARGTYSINGSTGESAFKAVKIGDGANIPAHASTNAAMSTLPSALGKVVRDGYAALGDVPSLTYIASDSACSLNGGSGDDGSQIPTSDRKCWIANFPSSGFDVRQFGAKGNGTTNDTVAVQRAINFACAAGSSPTGYSGGDVLLPRGAYLLTGGVSIPAACSGLHIKGAGFGTSGGTYVISNNTCAAPVIDFYPNAVQNYVYGGGVSDVYFFNNKLVGGAFDGTTSCQQPLIRASFGRNMLFDHIAVLSPKIFIKIIGGLNNTVRDISVDQALAGSTGVFEFMGLGATPASGQSTRQDGTNLDNVTVFAAPASPGQQWYIGVWNHGFSQTVRITKAAFQSTSTALKVDCTNPGVAAGLLATTIDACPGNSYVYDLEGECSGSDCVSLEDTYSWYFQTLYGACLARTSTANPSTSGCVSALSIRNSQFNRTGTISVLGGQLNGAQASCVDIGGWQVTITGVNTYGCNAANRGGADYIIQAPGANLSGSNSIVNNRMCTGPANNSINENGVNIITGSNHNTVSLNNWKGCAAGIIGTPGANSVVGNNVGP